MADVYASDMVVSKHSRKEPQSNALLRYPLVCASPELPEGQHHE
jgi:hypothetical protein